MVAVSLTLEDDYRCAMHKLVSGERESAIRSLQRLVSRSPHSTRYRMALQAAQTARQRAMLTEMSSASTEELMVEALKLKETHELRAALRFIKRRQWLEADRALSASLSDREDQLEKQILLALVRSRGRQAHRAALAPALRAVALSPTRQDALYLLEEIQFANAQPEKALAVRLRAWEQAGGDPRNRREAQKRLQRFIPAASSDIKPAHKSIPHSGTSPRSQQGSSTWRARASSWWRAGR